MTRSHSVFLPVVKKRATSRCYACRRELPVEQFSSDRSKASGHGSICRSCDNEKKKRWYIKNRDRLLAKNRKPPRVCARCGSRTTLSARHLYCESCRPLVRLSRNQRSNTHDRGYGAKHQRARREWVERVEAGGVNCARCGLPIEPGSRWDLGHDDFDRSVYSGPEHRACNRATMRHPGGKRRSRKW